MEHPKLKTRGFGLEMKPSFSGLRRLFLVPPFSVFRTMGGEWMKRKRQWLALGIKSEVGRGGVPGGSKPCSNTKGPDGKFLRDDMHMGMRERVSKMALHNDPMQRKRKYDEQG